MSHNMISRYLRWLQFTVFGSVLTPAIVCLCTLMSLSISDTIIQVLLLSTVVAAPIPYVLLERGFKKLRAPVERESTRQAAFIDRIPERWIPRAIVLSAAVSLILELAVIRWQGSVFEFFAFYKNFSLLACFAGLGLGYSLSRIKQIPLICAIPTLALQMLLLIGLRHGFPPGLTSSLLVMPFNEETNVVFMDHQANALNFVAIYFFLAVTFSLTTLSFMPVGQLCGRLMMRMEPLRAYSWNLLGSIVGIAVMLLLSTFWTPPMVWFAVAFTGCFVFTIYHRRPMLVTGAGAIVALITLAWPVNFLSEVVYSPYQMLERGKGEHGWSVIKAAGQYYQRILDLSPAAQQAYPELKPKAAYYDFVFQAVPKVGDVAIVGAGTGNDVAAALRGNATHVDAVELDPAILGIGLAYHPENPYKDPRVNRVVDDARAFMRSTDKKYDTIVMGLLDSHTLVSQASSLRVDSYVYTVEALKNARSRLKDNGSLSLAFAVYAPDLGHKLYRMMTEAFDGKPPVCVSAQHYDSAMIFIQSKDGDYKVPPGLVEKIGFKDVSSEFAAAQSSVAVATDDWPFFYMTQRVFPVSYIPMALLVLAMSFAFFVSLYGQKPQASALPFALLGAGFMLIETKAITELGLHFGNTWAINGIVIGAILLMAFFSNLAVLKLDIKKPAIPFILLLATIGAGLFVSYNGGFPSTAMGKLAAAVVLTSPIFFSGIVFSCLLKAHGNIDSAMFMNLLGAMFGGLLEYNAMYFGYRALYVIALAIYLLAFLMAVRKRSSNTQTSSASAPSTA